MPQWKHVTLVKERFGNRTEVRGAIDVAKITCIEDHDKEGALVHFHEVSYVLTETIEDILGTG